MDANEALKQKLPGFAGYGDLAARRLTDGEVRAYLGERLAGLSVRLDPTGAAAERLDGLILRAEFMNQQALPYFDSTTLDASHIEAVAGADLATVELADRADGVFNVDMLPDYLDKVAAAMDARDRAMQSSRA